MASKPRLINVEPLMFLFAMGNTLNAILYPAVFAFKQCLERRPDEHDLCQSLGTRDQQESSVDDRSLLNEVQITTARYLILNQVALTLPSFALALFIGGWCDRNGRKPPLIMATGGTAIAIVLVLLCASVDAVPSTVLIVASFIRGCTGQFVIIQVASFAMIADSVTTGQKLNSTQFTIRVSIASGCIAGGAMLGSLLSGIILHYFGTYSYVYAFGCGFMTLATIYAVFFVQETLHWPTHYVQNLATHEVQVGEKEELEEIKGTVEEAYNSGQFDAVAVVQSTRHWAVDILVNMKETFVVLFKRREGRQRMYLLFTSASVLAMYAFEPSGIFQLFVKRPPLSLADDTYSYLVAVSQAAQVIAQMVCVVCLKRLFGMSDLMLIIIGLSISIGQKALMAFSTTGWMILVAATVGALSALETVGLRSFFGTLVESSERGRLYAAVFIMDEIGPLLSTVICNNLYALTLPWFPGAVYLLKCIVGAIALVVFGWMYIDSHVWRGAKIDQISPAQSAIEGCVDGHDSIAFDESTPLLKKTESKEIVVL